MTYDHDAASSNANPGDGAFDADGRSYPGEQFPIALVDGGIEFKLGSASDGEKNAVVCRGQKIALPAGEFDRVHFLAAAGKDTSADFRVGDRKETLDVQAWTGFVGQWDNRLWDTEFPEVDYRTEGKVTGIETGYIKPARVAWYSTHRHSPDGGNEAYCFTYLFHYVLDAPSNASELTLPNDPSIRVFAVSVFAQRECRAAGGPRSTMTSAIASRSSSDTSTRRRPRRCSRASSRSATARSRSIGRMHSRR